MALDFATIGALIEWLATKHHHGRVYPMAARVGLSPAALHKLRHDLVRNPTLSTLYAIADAYGVSRSQVLEVATRRPTKRARKVLACLLGALTAMGMVPALSEAANATIDRPHAPELAHYVKRFLRRWRGNIGDAPYLVCQAVRPLVPELRCIPQMV